MFIERKRIIEVGAMWYFLLPNAPEQIENRDELVRNSGHRAPRNRLYSALAKDYEIEVREDLAE